MMRIEERRRGMAVMMDAAVAAAALALLTWGATGVQVRAEPAALLYLFVVVLAGLRGRLFLAMSVALAGTILWDQFFTLAEVTQAQRALRDVVTLAAFSATAIVITRLVTALRSSESRWKNVFENNPTMYFIVSQSGAVVSVNPAGAEQLGYTAAELTGQPVLNVFLEDDKAAARVHLERCLARLGESMSWELRKVRKNGEMLWVRETARAVQTGWESPVVLIACEDITAERVAHDKLRENEARLRRQASLLDLTHDSVFARDANGVITYWNRGAAERYGWSSAEAMGAVSHQLLKTVFPGVLDEITARLQRAGRWEGELVHTKRDGSRIAVASRWSVQRDEQGATAVVLETNNDITERKRVEEELRRSEAYLTEAQRLSHTGSLGWRVSDEVITCSDETYRIFGFDRATRPSLELIRDRCHPDDRALVDQTIERARQEATDFDLGHRLLMPDGSVKHLRVVAHAVSDESGRAEFVGAVMDVTAQKEAEEERRAHLRFLESMNRVNRAIQGTGDLEQMMRDVLEAVLSIFDCNAVALTHPCDPDATSFRVVTQASQPRPDVQAEGLREFPVDRETAKLIRIVMASSGPVRFGPASEHPILTGRANEIGTQSALVMALYPKMDAPYMFALSQHSYARVWTEREERLFQEIGRRLADALTTSLLLRSLTESARRYRNIFEMADVSIWEEDFSQLKAAIEELRDRGVTDFRQYFVEHPEFVEQAVTRVRIVDVNDATLRLFGARSKEELLVSLDKIFTPETLEVFAGELLAVAERRMSFAAETVVQTLGGQPLDVLFTLALPPETNLESVLVSIMDVTARKRAEEALRTAHAELARASTLTTMGQLAGSIAHELRQPLTAIAMNGSAALRWLNRESPNLDEAREAASRIVREAQRADEVIRGLRALIGKSGLQREPHDVNDAIHEVLELARGELRRSEVWAQTDLDPRLPPAFGDRVQLQQVLLNLVVNAIEAMAPIADRTKVLLIRTERAENGEVAVTVEDTGPGLEAATASRVFDPFFTTKADGLGLGLSICRSIVEAHGGRLFAAPSSPYGTAFRFTVPTVVQASDAPSPTLTHQAHVDTAR
jgi:PAS domain S-box-containing protein